MEEEGYDSTSELDDEVPVKVTQKRPPPPPLRPRRFVHQCVCCHQVFGTRRGLQGHSQVHFGVLSTATKKLKSQHAAGGTSSNTHTENLAQFQVQDPPVMKPTELINLLPDPLALSLASPPSPPPSLELTLGSGLGQFLANETLAKASVSNINPADDDNTDLALTLSPP